MSIPVVSEAAAMAAGLFDTDAVIERTGVDGRGVTCDPGRYRILFCCLAVGAAL